MTLKTSRVLKFSKQTQLKLNITAKRWSRCFSLAYVDALGLDDTKQEQGITWTETEENILLFPGCPGRQSLFAYSF